MESDFEVLVTAEEAFPAFERAVLNARKNIIAGFRIFDMTTRLHSTEARAFGETWFDLLAHVVRGGVDFDLTVSDFDPVMATDLHEMAWITVRQGAALAELAGSAGGKVRVRASLHPARAGSLPRAAFLPAVMPRLRKARAARNEARLARQALGLSDGTLPQMNTVSHHQKLAVIDDTILYVGGLDLNERRFDTPDHDRPSRETWSDVQVMLRGSVAREARRHLESFEAVTAGDRPLMPCPGLLRTLSAPRRVQFPFLSPRTILSELEDAHLRAFREARHHIHIETQFLRSQRIAEGLAGAAAQNPDLTATIIIPGTPDELAHDDHDGLDMRFGLAREQAAIGIVEQGFGPRVTIASPVRPLLAARSARATLAGSELIHVHNKVLLKDDDYLLISSANLNGRSLRWDTEVGVETTRTEHFAQARSKLFSHWWFKQLPDEALCARTRHDWWRREIMQNHVRRPENRTGFLVPFDPSKNADLAQPLPGVTEDIV